MAKMHEGFQFTGTIGNITFYQMWGNIYARKKSSLTRKQVLKSKAFEKTRKCAGDLGRAARIGAVIYKALPADIKERWLYRAITGEAASLLYEGKEEQEVKDLLWKKYIQDTGVEEEAKAVVPLDKNSNTRYRNLAGSSRTSNIQLREAFGERWEKQGRSYYWFKRAWQKRGYFNPERFRDILSGMDRPGNKSFG